MISRLDYVLKVKHLRLKSKKFLAVFPLYPQNPKKQKEAVLA